MPNDDIRFCGGLEPAIRLQDFMDETEKKILERISMPPTHRIFVSTPRRSENPIISEIKMQNRRARNECQSDFCSDIRRRPVQS
jgi:hypothetical protein